ncbi:MAG TPA: YraN family protein [Actinocrinis sp.]|nr:YraN family protein [Actinocrinis sp.]
MDGAIARGRRDSAARKESTHFSFSGSPGGPGSPPGLAGGRSLTRRHDLQRRLGAYGEAEAARYLELEGYRIIERNWTCHDPDLRGELDLIAGLRRTIVVCEVKTRSTGRLAHPAEAVTRAKAVRLRRLAVRWLAGRRNRPGGQRLIRQVNELRIDVIAIRTEPAPPFAILELDHLVGVA